MAGYQHSDLTEDQLIKRCLEGDRLSCKIIFDRFAGKMMSVCMRYSKSRQAAEDVMQDGFIRVFKKLHTFQHKGSFEGWIRTIMVNTALKALSNKHNRHEIISIDNTWDLSFEPEVLAYLGEEELLKLIADLPTGYQTVFNLYAIEGFSHKEIGERLNIGESTSRSQLVKARNLLKKMVVSLQKRAV